MKHRIPTIALALLMASCLAEEPTTQPAPSTSPGPATQPVIREYVRRIRAALPKGWSVETEKDTVMVSRKKPVEWYGTISLPSHDKAKLKAMGGFIHSMTYSIKIRFAPPMSKAEAARLTLENKRTSEKYYRKHPVDPNEKPTAPPAELTGALHPIPDILNDKCSMFLDVAIQGPGCAFYDEADEAECRKVEKAVLEILKSSNIKDSKTNPATTQPGSSQVRAAETGYTIKVGMPLSKARLVLKKIGAWDATRVISVERMTLITGVEPKVDYEDFWYVLPGKTAMGLCAERPVGNKGDFTIKGMTIGEKGRGFDGKEFWLSQKTTNPTAVVVSKTGLQSAQPAVETPMNRATQKQLRRKIPKITFDKSKLADTIQFFRELANLNIVVNWKSLESAKIRKVTPVSLNLLNPSMKDALEGMLKNAGGDGKVAPGYVVDEEGVITIALPKHLGLRCKITLPKRPTKKSLQTHKTLMQTLPKIDLPGVKFVHVMQFFREFLGVPIVVDWKALKSAGIDARMPVNLHLSNVSAGKILEKTLENAGGLTELSCVIDEEGVIQISTKKTATTTTARSRLAK